LDEISMIRGWTSTLKLARDGTSFGDDTVIVSGSRWQQAEDVEGNLLAGRAGSNETRRIRHLHPMGFRSFLEATRPELVRPSRVHPANLQDPDVASSLEALRFDVDAYDLAWQDYLTCGGFPRAVFEHERNGAVSKDYFRDLAAWLRGDVEPDQRPESIPVLLSTLCGHATSPLNIARAAESMGYTRAAFEVRLDRLVSTSAAHWCPHRDDRGNRVVGAQSKLYLTDPVLAWLPSQLRAGLPEPDMTALTEMAMGISQARAIDDLEETRWIAADTIGFTRTGGPKEIDLAPVPTLSSGGAMMTVPIEAKWVDSGWRSEAKVVEGKYGSGVLATKSLLDLDHPSWAVPAPLVALLLE